MRMVDCMPRFMPQGLMMVMRAFANDRRDDGDAAGGRRGEELMRLMEERAAATMSSFSPKELSTCLAAMKKMGFVPGRCEASAGSAGQISRCRAAALLLLLLGENACLGRVVAPLPLSSKSLVPTRRA